MQEKSVKSFLLLARWSHVREKESELTSRGVEKRNEKRERDNTHRQTKGNEKRHIQQQQPPSPLTPVQTILRKENRENTIKEKNKEKTSKRERERKEQRTKRRRSSKSERRRRNETKRKERRRRRRRKKERRKEKKGERFSTAVVLAAVFLSSCQSIVSVSKDHYYVNNGAV